MACAVGPARLCTTIAVALLWSAVSAEPGDAPAGYVRRVERGAYVVSGLRGARRPVAPFAPVFAGETVVAQGGGVVVVDVRSAAVHDIPAGTRWVVPRTVDLPAPPDGLVDLLRRATRPLRPRAQGAVRGDEEGPAWPDGVAFAPEAHLEFRWSSPRPARTFVLVGPAPAAGRGTYRRQDPPNPMPWPDDAPVRRVPGWYEWRVLDEDVVLASGSFRLLSGTEASARREAYRREAEARFAERADIAAELLAAADGCRLR